MNRGLWRSLFYIAVLGPSLLHAELVWENRSLTVNGRSGDASATGVFRFVNRGQNTIRIISVNPSCGCTVAKPVKDLVAPGEPGEIPARLALSRGETTRSVTIKVATDEGPAVQYDLSLSVHLAEAVQMVPRLLYWKMGEPRIAKRITLNVQDEVEVTGVEVQGSGFHAQLGPNSASDRSVWVTPTDTREKITAQLLLKLRQRGREISVPHAFLRVTE